MRYIADWHLHSKYSRACSRGLTLENIDQWAKLKGVNIVGTADFLHPLWFKDIEQNLEEVQPGLYRLKGSKNGTLFILSDEISCIYSQGGKTRRLHISVLAPNLEFVRKLYKELENRGCNLKSDGRPIIGVSAKELLKICQEIDPNHLTIPAHAWTPWFAIFGSKSGFDSIEECYEELSPHIHAIETGLSSDPLMNWRLSALDKVFLVSNSDAHSAQNIGREANVFDLSHPSFEEIRQIFVNRDKKKFLYTIEFFPEEGIYHYDGHRECKVSWSPSETRKHKGICPVCKKLVTVGTMSRVESLADRKAADIDKSQFVPFKSLIPLRDLIADIYKVNKNAKKVEAVYFDLIKKAGSEFAVLLDLSLEQLKKLAGEYVTTAVEKMRAGQVKLIPGFDGQYGKIEIFPEKIDAKKMQDSLF
jgi:DNA helicase II / ATP-dependent DNA helicase PcrA